MSAGIKELRLALIDSRPFVCAAVRYLLETGAPHHLTACFRVRTFASPGEFVAHGASPDVDVAVFNIGAATTADRPIQEEVRQLQQHLAQLPLILMCDHTGISHALDAVRLGIKGYVPTMLNPAVAMQAICLVHAGGTFLPAESLVAGVDGHVNLVPDARSPVLAEFTSREREVVARMWQGKSNKVIARDLTVSESTVKVYVRQIMKKLGANNRTHAVFLLSQSRAGEEPN